MKTHKVYATISTEESYDKIIKIVTEHKSVYGDMAFIRMKQNHIQILKVTI